jgi:hypothetical protein
MTKTILGAIALALAVPAFAQTAPATDPHAGHGQQQPMDHSKHSAGAKHDCKECCEKMKGKDGKMECMDKAEGKPAPAGHDSHDAH